MTHILVISRIIDLMCDIEALKDKSENDFKSELFSKTTNTDYYMPYTGLNMKL